MAYQETFAQRNQHRIYVRENPGAEPAIVLMHGFPDNLHLYDRLVPYQFHEFFPGSDLFLIEGAQHFVQLDEPEQVARLILEMAIAGSSSRQRLKGER